jgi:hypothetical protein
MVESSKMLVELSNMGIFGWSMDWSEWQYTENDGSKEPSSIDDTKGQSHPPGWTTHHVWKCASFDGVKPIRNIIIGRMEYSSH